MARSQTPCLECAVFLCPLRTLGFEREILEPQRTQRSQRRSELDQFEYFTDSPASDRLRGAGVRNRVGRPCRNIAKRLPSIRMAQVVVLINVRKNVSTKREFPQSASSRRRERGEKLRGARGAGQ